MKGSRRARIKPANYNFQNDVLGGYHTLFAKWSPLYKALPDEPQASKSTILPVEETDSFTAPNSMAQNMPGCLVPLVCTNASRISALAWVLLGSV